MIWNIFCIYHKKPSVFNQLNSNQFSILVALRDKYFNLYILYPCFSMKVNNVFPIIDFHLMVSKLQLRWQVFCSLGRWWSNYTFFKILGRWSAANFRKKFNWATLQIGAVFVGEIYSLMKYKRMFEYCEWRIILIKKSRNNQLWYRCDNICLGYNNLSCSTISHLLSWIDGVEFKKLLALEENEMNQAFYSQ